MELSDEEDEEEREKEKKIIINMVDDLKENKMKREIQNIYKFPAGLVD